MEGTTKTRLSGRAANCPPCLIIHFLLWSLLLLPTIKKV